jgi:hypothetical protein
MSFSRTSARAVKQALRAPSVAKRSIALAARQQVALNAAVKPQVARNVLGVSAGPLFHTVAGDEC